MSLYFILLLTLLTLLKIVSSLVAATILQLPDFAIGKVTPIFALKQATDGWSTYPVVFTKTLAIAFNTQQAAVSLINFDCYSSNQFSINSQVSNITLTGFTLMTTVLGNSYFTEASFQYISLVYNLYSSSPQWISRSCFLCSDLVKTTGTRSSTFKQINLYKTNQSNIQVISSISGLKMYNNYQLKKSISIFSFMKANDSYLYQTISTTGQTQIEWVCISTIIVQNANRVHLSDHIWIYNMGNATLAATGTNLNWPNVPTIYTSANQKFFGLNKLQLLSNDPEQTLIIKSEEAVDFKKDFSMTSVAGQVSYFFIAQQTCPDSNNPNYFFVDQNCYDTCGGNKYLETVTYSRCQLCHYTCLTCVNATSIGCSTCDATINKRSWVSATGICECNNLAFQYDLGVPICFKCSTNVPWCQACTSTTFCTSCQCGLIFDPIATQCVCPTGLYFVTASCLCLPFPGCQNAASATTCSTCSAALNFVSTPNLQSCMCSQFYQISPAGVCLPKCGDGVNLVANETTSCDDGNAFNGDGCTTNCTIQSGYACVNTQYGVSICAPLRSPTITYLYTQRVRGSNIGILVFSVSPPQPLLSAPNFVFTSSSSIAYSSLSVSYSANPSLLRVRFEYVVAIEQSKQNLSISFDPVHISMPATSHQLSLKGSNLQLTFQSSSMCQQINILGLVASFMVIAVFFLLIAMDHKLAATQLILSAQLVFIASFAAGNNPGITCLTSLKFLAGFNDIRNFAVDVNNYQISHILSMQSFKQFIFNFNIMLIIQLLSVVMMLPFKIRIWKFQDKKQALLSYQYQRQDQSSPFPTISQTKKQIQQATVLLGKYLNKIYYPISLLCMIPSTFYFGLQSYAANINTTFYINAIWSIVVTILALMLNMGFMVYLYQQSDKNKPVFTFKTNVSVYPFVYVWIYFIITFIYASSLGLAVSFYVVAGLSILPLVYRVVSSPYAKFLSFQSIDSLLKLILSTAGIGILFVQKTATSSSQIISLIVVIVLLLNVLLSIARLIIIKVSQKKNRGPLTTQNPDKQGSGKQIRSGQDDDQNQNEDQDQKLKQKEKDNQQSQQDEQQFIKDNSQTASKQAPLLNLENTNALIIEKDKLSCDGTPRHNAMDNFKDQQNQIDNEDQGQLALIKRKLKADLKKRRGLVNKTSLTKKKAV